jgi:hypothetical protein
MRRKKKLKAAEREENEESQGDERRRRLLHQQKVHRFASRDFASASCKTIGLPADQVSKSSKSRFY